MTPNLARGGWIGLFAPCLFTLCLSTLCVACNTFRVVRFSDRASEPSEAPLLTNAENLQRARAHLGEMTALGTTEMRRGLHAALSPEIAQDRIGIALLLTDGYIGNEAEVLREVDAALGQARVFALGVGASVNRCLLSRLIELGRGELSVVSPSESPEVTIHGRVAGRPFAKTVEVTLPEGVASRPEVGSLWARARVRDLMNEMSLRPTDALRETITRVGLEHSLMTQWTAFVAVDDGEALPSRVDYGGAARRVGNANGTILIGSLSGGAIGAGYGAGGGMAARVMPRVPVIRMAAATVRGRLSRQVIRRVVRRQMNALRFCYERRLAVRPDLAGRVTVRIVIGATGELLAAGIADSALNDEPVERCLVGVFERMRFPAVDGGSIIEVSYPLVFHPPETPRYAPRLPRPIPL